MNERCVGVTLTNRRSVVGKFAGETSSHGHKLLHLDDGTAVFVDVSRPIRASESDAGALAESDAWLANEPARRAAREADAATAQEIEKPWHERR